MQLGVPVHSKSILGFCLALLLVAGGCSDGATGANGAGTGSGGTAGSASDTSLFVPENLSNTEVNGEGGLTLLAFTLVQGAAGPELYAAARNDSDTPACDPGMTTHFTDKAGQLVATVSSVLLSGSFYLLGDGSGAIIPCVGPGQTAMLAATDLPDSIVIEELGYLQHTFPAFPIDEVTLVEALSISNVEAVGKAEGTAYTGTLTNLSQGTVSDASVTLFPVNAAGRPLGAASSVAPGEIAQGGTWTFETGTVVDPGVGFVAYPDATIPF